MDLDASKTKKENKFIMNNVLNILKTNLYITDIDTDEIIFMNQAMKEEYGIEEPEGKICWKVFAQNKEKRCGFCPVDWLKDPVNENKYYEWEEFNAITQKAYRNSDSLIKWWDGRTVHLQQSIDVTELKRANIDELTCFLTRRAGKENLLKMMNQIKNEKFNFTVCLYDINLLKEVNDKLGHAEGDRLLTTVSDAVRDELGKNEYAFRLSGDEFVIIFLCGLKTAEKRIEAVREKIKNLHDSPAYEKSFSFGLVEINADNSLSVDEVLFLADKKMYEQKRSFHIATNEKKLQQYTDISDDKFEYDTERLYDALEKSTDDYIYICNMRTGIFKYSKTMVEEFDLPGEIIENAAAVWGGRVHEDDKAVFLESNQIIADGRSDTHCVEYRALNRDGEWVWVRCRGYLERDDNGEPAIFAGFITNLGKRNKFDSLTGLFDKIEFQDQINRLLLGSHHFSVMVLGIDDLKHINDLYNRSFGDEVIRQTTQKVSALLPKEAVFCRLDGDVFGIILQDADHALVESIYRSIYHSFKNQHTYNGKKYYCTLSGGCLFCPEDANNYDDILKYVGYCLEVSKNNGKKQCTYFSKEILDKRAYSLELIEFLRESIENDFQGFSLAYQPLVDARSGRLLGAEALARWESDKVGVVSPIEFIPLLESTGLIIPVGKWIFKTAIAACKKWIELKPDFIIDINLSYVQVRDFDFLNYVDKVIKNENFAPENLVLELTESYFMQDNEHIKKVFQEIRKIGVRIAMDDFGTGYSSLGMLKESPADIVKIDKTFVRDISNSNFDTIFIRFVVELCHAADIKVCLEGVETVETYNIVRPMGLNMIQGYLFDRPLSEQAFTEKYFNNK